MPHSIPTSLPLRIRAGTTAAAAALALTACGGGGGDDPVTPVTPAPATVTLSGEVAVNGTLKNVVVCLDRNANAMCDVGEPASAPTAADGKYTLTYDPAVVTDAATARLIAPVRAGDPSAASTAIDSTHPTVAVAASDYVLSRPAGSGGAINPLTTLVQAGVAAGMTEAVARENVALQLAIAAAKVDAYQDDPATTNEQLPDTARTAALVVETMLESKVPLVVGDQKAALTASSTLANLSYGGASDFYLQTLDRSAKAAGTAGLETTDARSGKVAGVARPEGGSANALYRTAYLGASGWNYCSRNVAIQGTIGNPSRSVSCGVRTTVSFTTGTSVADQAMTDLVTRWQTLASNTINAGVSTAGLVGALGNAKFPAGAEEQVRTNLVLSSDITIDNVWTRGLPQDRNTLETVVARYPASAVALPGPGGSLSMGITTGVLRNLRVAFGAATSATAGAAQFYECDLNADQSVASNCAATATGTYAMETVNGQRILRFSGQPATPAVNYDVVYAQVDWGGGNQWVYRAHAIKPSLQARMSTASRLNGAAWGAMKAQLGL